MSREAIAAALARDDLAGGERLVAFSLASFAGRDDRAWPGASIAAARAGLSRSRYLYDRDRLVRRGLVVVADAASGRGRASTVVLRFVSTGPWWEGDINAELLEAVLSRTRRRGPARLLLAAMAAFADIDGIVSGLSKDELCSAAGIKDRTYRRARAELLRCGEVELVESGGGLVGELGREWFLRDALDPVLDRYDHVLIDTPPNLGLLTVNALVCADRVLSPASVEDEASLHGILELRQTIAKLSERLGIRAPELDSVVMRWQRHRISGREIEAALVAAHLAPVGRIPSRSALFARAAARRVPLSVGEPDSSPAIAYGSLAETVVGVSAR